LDRRVLSVYFISEVLTMSQPSSAQQLPTWTVHRLDGTVVTVQAADDEGAARQAGISFWSTQGAVLTETRTL
jgi:hypothetical protein